MTSMCVLGQHLFECRVLGDVDSVLMPAEHERVAGSKPLK